MLNNIYRNVELVQSEQWITSSTPRYNIKDAFYYQPCVTLPMINYIWILYYIISAPLHHQRCITSSKTHYTVHDVFYHQHSFTLLTWNYIINAELHHPSMLHYIIKAALHRQRCFTSLTLLYIVNAS